MKTGILFLLFTVSIFFIGCAGPEKKILGTWKPDTMENFYFTFTENGELNVNGEIFMKYSFTPDKKLVLGQEEPVSVTIKGNTMHIHQEGQGITLIKMKRLEKRR